MEEEKKEVEVVEEKPENQEPKTQENQEMIPESKNALIAFILSVIGFGFAWAWLLSVVAVVLGIVGLNYLKMNEKETEEQPFRTFGRIAKPVAIVDIALGAVMFVVYLIVLIVKLVSGE